MLPPLARGHQPHLLCPWVDPGPLLGLSPWVLAGMGEGREQPPAPLLGVICLFFRPLPNCPSLT